MWMKFSVICSVDWNGRKSIRKDKWDKNWRHSDDNASFTPESFHSFPFQTGLERMINQWFDFQHHFLYSGSRERSLSLQGSNTTNLRYFSFIFSDTFLDPVFVPIQLAVVKVTQPNVSKRKSSCFCVPPLASVIFSLNFKFKIIPNTLWKRIFGIFKFDHLKRLKAIFFKKNLVHFKSGMNLKIRVRKRIKHFRKIVKSWRVGYLVNQVFEEESCLFFLEF